MDKRKIKIWSRIFSVGIFLLVLSMHNFHADASVEVPISGGTYKLDHSISSLSFKPIKVNNVGNAFNSIPTKGNWVDLSNLNGTLIMDSTRLSLTGEHIQGAAKYGDYTILSANHRTKKGTFFIYKGKKIVKQVHLPYDHPGGIAACGDLLAVGSTDNGVIYTRLYDLSPIQNGNDPIELFKFKDFAEASVGLTSFEKNGKTMIVIGADDGRVMMSEVPSDGQTFTWNYYNVNGDAIPNNVRQNCAMITDTNNNVYWIALEDEDYTKKVLFVNVPKVNDYLNMYRLSFDDKNKTVTRTGRIRKKFSMPNDTSIYPHFRWGASVFPADGNNLSIFCTPSLPGYIVPGSVKTPVYYHCKVKPNF